MSIANRAYDKCAKRISDLNFDLILKPLLYLFGANVISEIGAKSKKISNDQELIQSDPTSCPQNQKGNN